MGSETDEVASLLEDSSDILDINEVNKIAKSDFKFYSTYFFVED